MEDAFGYVLFGVVAVAAVLAVVAIVGVGRVYEQIGKGGLSLRDGTDRPLHEPKPAVAAAEREEEIRQMLEARNDRRARRGEAPLDVEAEIAELTRPAHDPSLVTEVRQLVEARNHRLVARGKPPLDVEAEVARQLRDLT
jgi:hypothetical protein